MPQPHSAVVKMSITIDGAEHKLAQVAKTQLYLREPIPAVLHLTVDGEGEPQRVLIKQLIVEYEKRPAIPTTPTHLEIKS